MTRHTFRPLLFVLPVVLLLLAVGLVRPAFPSHAASASITLSLTYGPPTSSLQVKGKGFKSGEAVTILFDTTPLKSVTAGSTGACSTTITIPQSAQPGNHLIQARGKSSGRIAQAIFLVQTDWVQTGFNRAHSGFNVFENMLNTTNVSQLTQNWVYQASAGYSSSVVVSHGVVYIGCNTSQGWPDNQLCALNAATGQLLWSYATGNSVSTPAVDNGIVYIASDDNTLYALNAVNGTVVWTYTIKGGISGSPLVANGIVFIGSYDQKLYALNGMNGTVVWSYLTKGIVSTPGIANGVIYTGSGDGNVYALNAQTGVLKWHYTTRGSITHTAVIASNIVYIISNDGNLYALNAQTGAFLWSRTSSPFTPDPSVANGRVYTYVGFNIAALNATSGALVWSFNPTSTYDDSIESNLVIANGVVYAEGEYGDAEAGVLEMLTAATGTLVGRVLNNDIGYFEGSPVVVNGIVYCLSDVGSLNTYHLSGATSKKSA